MNKDKIESLSKYKLSIENKLLEPTPAKHKHRPEQYKTFLKNELKLVTSTILKLKGLE
jgi:hypothetical protein